MEDWPSKVSEDLKVFHAKRGELLVERGCVLWGVWWRKIDMAVEGSCKECGIYQQEQ